MGAAMTIRVYRLNPATGERKELFECSTPKDAKARDRLMVSDGWPPCGCTQCLWGEGAWSVLFER
jgi:hypothetical protein